MTYSAELIQNPHVLLEPNLKARYETLMAHAVSMTDLEITEVTEKIANRPYPEGVLKAAYQFCRVITQSHYENFPVASVLMPKHLRPAVEAIYAFSRTADDFADEAEYKDVRLEKLGEWSYWLHDDTKSTHPIFIALQDTISRFSLNRQLFADLLHAFKTDVTKTRYENFSEVLSYCRYSANPVGRLVLQLFSLDSTKNVALSDHICTGLQLANFWQDVAIDLNKNRLYLPQDDMEKFNVSFEDLQSHKVTDSFKRLLGFQLERTHEIFLKGKELGLVLDGRLGLEIRLTWLTGVTILKKIRLVGHDIFNKRPTLSKRDFAKMFMIAISKKRYDKFVL